MLVVACLGAAVLWGFNRGRVGSIGPYVVVGLLIWVCVLKSGVHATLAGVVAALAIPLSDGKGGSPLRTAEHAGDLAQQQPQRNADGHWQQQRLQ